MMNPTTITNGNGGSLEDCHTNFFALTDLCGIRWRKFVNNETTNDPLNDPILRSYARCLQVNILCVWRRIPIKKNGPYQSHLFEQRMPNTVTYPSLSLKTSKELWIFWYGEEPAWGELLVPELIKNTVETADGSWENGINYDCRSLLFKALHNLIERCLLSRGIVRLGKWFVQPCTRHECSLESGSHHISFSFGFFVHGESMVCTSMDLRIHPNVRQLTHEHLKAATLSSDYNQNPVILAPFGLAGTLTGKAYRSTDAITKKTLKEWSIFYPLLNRTESHLPPVVEVVAGGVKMCYPARYVLVADNDSETFSYKTITKMLAQDDANEVENENKLCEPIELERYLSERVWQECVVCPQLTKSTSTSTATTTTTSTTTTSTTPAAASQSASSTPAAGGDEETEVTEKPSDFENPTNIKTCNCPIRESPHCSTHLHNQQLISNLMSTIPTQLDSPSSPDSSSPYSTYPPSVSPTKGDENVLQSMSPIHSFDLSNFSDAPNEVPETHSPDRERNTPASHESPNSGDERGGGGGGENMDPDPETLKNIKMEMNDEEEHCKSKNKSKSGAERDDGDGDSTNDNEPRRSLENALPGDRRRRSSGQDMVHGHSDNSARRTDQQRMAGDEAWTPHDDLNAVADFEIDTNNSSSLNFVCFGTVNDDVIESAFDESALSGDGDCEKPPKAAEESVPQRREAAENSDDGDDSDDSDDSSENDDDSSDSDDSDDESNTPNDDMNKAHTKPASAENADGNNGGGESVNCKKEEENQMLHANGDGREKTNDSEQFDGTEAKRTKDNGQDTDATAKVENQSETMTDGDSGNATNETCDNNRSETNENSNISAATIASNPPANDDSNDESKLTNDVAGHSKCVEDTGDKVTDKARSHFEALKMSADPKRIKSEPNSRNISPLHRSGTNNGNHSADELLLSRTDKNTPTTAELRNKCGDGNEYDTKTAARNLLGTATHILAERQQSSNSTMSERAHKIATLRQQSGFTDLDLDSDLESFDGVANLLSNDLDLDSDDNHDIFHALNTDHLDNISDSNSEDGMSHGRMKEKSEMTNDKSIKSENATSATADDDDNNDDAKTLPRLEYKPWQNELQNSTGDNAANATVKLENIGSEDAENAEKPRGIDALFNAPLMTSIKQELDCNETLSNETGVESNEPDFHAAIELQMKRRQSPENGFISNVKTENQFTPSNDASDAHDDESVVDSVENIRRGEQTTTSNDSFGRHRARKRPRPQYFDLVLPPPKPITLECLRNRPKLNSHNYETFINDDDSDTKPRTLYDFSALDAWMEHPVKRFKPNEPSQVIPQQIRNAQKLLQDRKPVLQDLYGKQNVVMANWATMKINRIEMKPLTGSTGSAESPDIQSDYEDECDGEFDGDTLSPSSVMELSPYGNIDILDPEDLDTFAEQFSHQQDWSFVSIASSFNAVYGQSKYAPISDVGVKAERTNFIYRPSWERTAAADSASKANSKSKSKNRNKTNKLSKMGKKNKSNVKAERPTDPTPVTTADAIATTSSTSTSPIKIKSESIGGPHSNSENNVNVGNAATSTLSSKQSDDGVLKKRTIDGQLIKTNESDTDSNDEKESNRQTMTQSTTKDKKKKKDKSSSKEKPIKTENATETNSNSKENDDNSDDSSPPYFDENSNDGNSDESHHNVDSDATKPPNAPVATPAKYTADDNSVDNLENCDEGETFKTRIVTVHIERDDDNEDEYHCKDGAGVNEMLSVRNEGHSTRHRKPANANGSNNGSTSQPHHKHKRNIETHDIIHNIEIQHYQPNDEYGDDANYNTDSGYVDATQTDENLISHFFTFGDYGADEPESANESDDSDSEHSASDDSIISHYSPSALPALSPYGSPPSSIVSCGSSLCESMENISPPVQRLPETNALILNLLLYDTSMNLFKDHNFDSCPLCICNTGQGHVGNIRGSESGMYQPMRINNGSDQSASASSLATPTTLEEVERNRRAILGSQPYVDNDPIYCSCGFSAMMNRKLSHRAGLFYDDETEITGMADDPHEVRLAAIPNCDDEETDEQARTVQRKLLEGATQLIMEYIQEQCSSIGNTGSSLIRAIRSINFKGDYYNMENAFINFVEYSDAQTMITMALDNSRLESPFRYRKNQIQTKSSNTFVNVHKWPYLKTGIPQNNKLILSFMKNMIMPCLKQSFNEKYMTRLWEAPSPIQGPLTWRQFHRMASSQAGQCEPQPIPSVIVGHEKDWLSVSPYAIQYWDQLALEPYSYARDVAYIVIAPDSKFIVDEAKQFFKELSTTYEMCKLGRHSPIKGFDGILCAETPAAGESSIEELEDLFKLFDDNKTIEILKSYAHTCMQHLVPYLTKIANDKSIFDPEPEGFNIKDFCYREKSMSSPLFQPDTPESTYVSEKEQIISFDNGNDCDMQMPYNNTSTPTPAPTPPTPTTAEPLCLTVDDDEEGVPPCIVIYILNPLPTGHDSDDMQRLACIGMLRCFANILSSVPDSMRNNIKLQIISMESILEIGKNGDWLRAHDEIRCLALSLFAQSRRHLIHDVNTKVLTGFGTASNLQSFIKNKDVSNRTSYKLYTPPFILSGRDEVIESTELFGAATIDTPSSIMYCNYCLSEDQKWLLAVVTDERGELLETVAINIEVADHEQRANTSIRRQSCQKLLDFIIGIISQTSQQWRIVIGRLGRIGHGELKAWSWLLSKANLVKASKQLKEVCAQCSMIYLNSCPSIVSACLLTLEPDSSFRIFSDQFTPDERFSQISMQSTLCTPTDLTCTHILVLPVNSVAQTTPSFTEHHIADFNEEELFHSLSNGGKGSGNMNSMNGMNNGGNMGSVNGNPMNGMNSMGLNGMNAMNGMNSGALNGVNGMDNVNVMGGMNDEQEGMTGDGLNNMNGLNDLNGVNDINNMNGIDGIDGMDAIDAMEGIEGMDGMDGMEGMEGMEDVNMNGIDDLFGNDWDIPASDDLSLSTDNPTVATLEPKTEADDTLTDNLSNSIQDQLSAPLTDAMNSVKSDMKNDFKQDQKPNILANFRQSMGHNDKNDQQNNMGQSHNNGEQQPLAIGFMVSTAPICKMPPWFWANCPHLENVSPVFLKCSLHVHSPLVYPNTNEFINQHFSQSGIHPLDSQFTTDTMRYILEGYNFLSWLTMDQNTNDRLSCLPFQIQVLVQLYNMVAAFT